MEAAKWVEMVRVNPGNYADKKKFARSRIYDDQYNSEWPVWKSNSPARSALQETGPGHAHLAPITAAERPHYEPIRRHAVGNGESAWNFARIAVSTITIISSSR